jgi:hypothetical protein
MLTISCCAHTPQSQSNGSIDLTLLDLNKLTELGTMYINIEAHKSGVELCTLARFDFDDKRMEIREIRSSIDAAFELINESRSEISRFGGIKSKKEWLKSIKCTSHTNPNEYLMRCNRSNDIGDAFEKQTVHRASSNRPFILEGIGMIRKRYWAMTGFVGTIEAQTLNVNGEPCKVTYYCGRRRVGALNGSPVEIVKIKQEIIQPNGTSDISKSIYLTTGHLLRHKFQWFGRSFIIHIDPLGSIPPDSAPIDFSVKGMSKFLNYLNEMAYAKLDEFVLNNKDIRNLVQCYILKLIAEKPNDVLKFTNHYFTKLGLKNEFALCE